MRRKTESDEGQKRKSELIFSFLINDLALKRIALLFEFQRQLFDKVELPWLQNRIAFVNKGPKNTS